MGHVPQWAGQFGRRCRAMTGLEPAFGECKSEAEQDSAMSGIEGR